MSTHKSQNLNLHLWEPDDDFLRTEFNENFTAIDAGLESTKGELETKIQTAQQTAEAKPYVTGSYVGNGQSVKVKLGFRPSFLIICGTKAGIGESSSAVTADYKAFTGGNILPTLIIFTNDGFTVKHIDSNGYYRPRLCHSDRVYDYIAFR